MAVTPATPLVPALPQLAPRMLLPGRRPGARAFPFDQADTEYFYQARNAIFALANAWQLRGQEVLFPAYCHGVELDALLAAGVRPAFYPVDTHMRVLASDVASRITPATRAVYLIHYLGFPGPVRELAAACGERGIPLIEDCALALFSRLGDRPLGSFGDAAIFCFHKSLPVPNGGALVVRGGHEASAKEPPPTRAALSLMAGSLRLHWQRHGNGMGVRLIDACTGLGRPVVRAAHLERVEVGAQDFDPAHARLAMSRLVSFVLARQDPALIVRARRANFLHLAARLRATGGLVFDELPEGVCPLFLPLRVRRKQPLIDQLAGRDIQAINFWSFEHPAAPRGAFPEVDELRRTVIELPCHQGLTTLDMDRIADATLELLGNR